MDSIKYQSEDGAFSVIFLPSVIDKIKCSCIKFQSLETGGVLVGNYSSDCHIANITDSLQSIPDSRHYSASYFRGVRGLKEMLDQKWKANEYYLGEWHSHPHVHPIPSKTDIDQMRTFSCSPGLHCPEPIMLIVGGDQNIGWQFAVFIVIMNQLLRLS